MPISHHMTETTMPAAEASTENFDERSSYELAFHVLPTVAEGEVAGVYEEIKAHITKKGEIFDEEAPERIDLVYPIVKSLDGKNRKYTSAYFGWVRFKTEAGEVAEMTNEIMAMPSVLRHLLVKLTLREEENPFRFHEYRKTLKTEEREGDSAEEVVAEVEDDAVASEEVVAEVIEETK